ncbi:hypothetical protein Bind_3739 (plasmid) [Beijerinckia indica subsp. indica ATCC 9039]|uniref:Uncharacterized protein n=1 Tax=Beijerinckia indica subsp. indica (strain ATCC 9039 / DSM 1715 / NCIMB 8712) TaxID=395963 RepID=B2IL90_BEII9|nr:hypothetical protein Bind_3739 [Beijerinckia indica subsp. indica ATCC 9039]
MDSLKRVINRDIALMIDTLSITKMLKEAGFSESQATALARAIDK